MTIPSPSTQGPAIELIKDGSLDVGADGVATPGDVISYTFAVTNTGNVTLTNVTVTDPLVTVVGGPLASLAPGVTDTTTFSASYAITQADIDAGEVYNTALANGTPPSGPDVTDDDDHTEPITQGPAIELIKDGSLDVGADGVATPGDVISYTFAVTNTGNVTLTNVTVTDPLVTVVGGPLASLAPGVTDTTTFSASYAITQADIDAGEVYNTALANGTPPSGPDVTDDDDHTEPITQGPAIELIKDGEFQDESGDGVAQPGETISYTFAVTNTGNVTLYNVTVTDPLVTVVGGPLASLAPGVTDTTTFSASYAVTRADITAGEVYNIALVEGACQIDAEEPCVEDPDDHTEGLPSGGGSGSGGGQPPTDMLAPSDIVASTYLASGNPFGTVMSWIVWLILSASLIMSAGWVIRRYRFSEIQSRSPIATKHTTAGSSTTRPSFLSAHLRGALGRADRLPLRLTTHQEDRDQSGTQQHRAADHHDGGGIDGLGNRLHDRGWRLGLGGRCCRVPSITVAWYTRLPTGARLGLRRRCTGARGFDEPSRHLELGDRALRARARLEHQPVLARIGAHGDALTGGPLPDFDDPIAKQPPIPELQLDDVADQPGSTSRL